MAKKAPLNLSDVQQLAINKIVSAAAYQKINTDLAAGSYPVSMAVRITGELTKGEKYESEVHFGTDWCQLFAYTLSKLNGVTVESIVKEYVTAKEDEKEFDATEIKAKAQAAVDEIKGLSKQTCAGKLTAKLECELIDTFGVEVK